MTWSTSDIVTLQSNCLYHMKNNRLNFLKKYVDLQMYCQEMTGTGNNGQIGLVAMAEMLGLNVDDIPHHRAVGDCIVSAQCLQKLYSKGAMKPHIQKADCNEFYEKLEFHNTYASSFENPLVDKSLMTMNCNLCGARADIQKDWEIKRGKLESSKNADYWIPKIEKNMKRDIEHDQSLANMGWTVIHFWGQDILKNTEECVRVIEEAIFENMIAETDNDVDDE